MPSIHFKSHPTFYPIRSSTYCEISFKMLVQRIKNTPEEIILTQCYVLIDRLGLSKCQVFRRKASDDQVFSWNLSPKLFNSTIIIEIIFIFDHELGEMVLITTFSLALISSLSMIFEFYIFWFWKRISFLGSNENNKIFFWNLLYSRSKIWPWFIEVSTLNQYYILAL